MQQQQRVQLAHLLAAVAEVVVPLLGVAVVVGGDRQPVVVADLGEGEVPVAAVARLLGVVEVVRLLGVEEAYTCAGVDVYV